MIDLERLLSEINLNQKELALLVGVTGQAVTLVKQNKMDFPKEWKKIINDKFKINVDKYEVNLASDPETLYIKQIKQIHPDPNGKEIPYYETEVFATISPAMGDVVALKPDTFIRIPMFSQGQFALTVTGNSMKGFINHGDWVVIRQITDREEIIFGEPHLIVTKADNFKTVKFLKEGDSPDKFWLVPYNVEQFEPQQIKKSSVLELYRVIGVFKTV